MRFYINILTTYYPDLDPPYDVYYQQILEQIELAEELGWECFMFNEHHFLGYGGLVANPAVLLAAAAARTSRIRLGPCIAILPLRHPCRARRLRQDWFRRQTAVSAPAIRPWIIKCSISGGRRGRSGWKKRWRSFLTLGPASVSAIRENSGASRR
jgi:hypothetical protein